jgi:outer membrane protein assembly factor BamA
MLDDGFVRQPPTEEELDRLNSSNERQFVNPETPTSIRSVHLHGNVRTGAEVFEAELQEAYTADTLGEIHYKLLEAVEELKKLDIFESVQVMIDKVHSDGEAETLVNDEMYVNDSGVTQADVVITVKEKKMLKAKAGTIFDGGEGKMETSVNLCNPFGKAEHLEGKVSYGRVGSNAMHVRMRQPRFFGLPVHLDLGLVNEMQVFERYSSYNEKMRGVTMALRGYDGVHQLTYGLGLRDVLPRRYSSVADGEPNAYFASPDIIRHALPSLKSSVGHIYTNDQRDSRMVPTSGSFVKVQTEYATGAGERGVGSRGVGLGIGTEHFLKVNAEVQRHWNLGPATVWGVPGFSLGLTGAAGLLHNFNAQSNEAGADTSDSEFSTEGGGGSRGGSSGGGTTAMRQSSSHISDRFFLGGGSASGTHPVSSLLASCLTPSSSSRPPPPHALLLLLLTPSSRPHTLLSPRLMLHALLPPPHALTLSSLLSPRALLSSVAAGTSLRGFDFKGAGPRAPPPAAGSGGALGGDALGGDAFYSALGALSFPFPHRGLASFGLRGHVFANCGTLLPCSPTQYWLTGGAFGARQGGPMHWLILAAARSLTLCVLSLFPRGWRREIPWRWPRECYSWRARVD